MTEMLTRPLTTENRVLRAVSGPDLSVSLGKSLSAVFDTPTMGGLAAGALDRAVARSAFDETEQQAMRDAERERAREKAEIDWQLQNGLIGEPDREAAYERLVELDRQKQVQLDGFQQQQIADGRLQTPEALTETYGDLGLKFDRPMTKAEASLLADGKRAEIIRDALIDKGPKGFLPGVAKFGAGLAGMAADPLEVATMFIPVVGQAGKASAIARFGRVKGRVAVGALEGGIGQAITEPLYYGLSRSAQLDYDMSDSLMNVGLGFVFGGGIGAVSGVLSRSARVEPPAADASRAVDDAAKIFDDAYRDTQMRARLMAEQRPVADAALRQFVNGQSVNVGGVMPRFSVEDVLDDLYRQQKDTAVYPITNALRQIRIHPEGSIAAELRAAGITSRTAPGLFSKKGAKDLDNLVASEFEGVLPGISGRVGVENGYLSQRGLVDAIVDELQGRAPMGGRGAITDQISEATGELDMLREAVKQSNAMGFPLRSEAEVKFVADALKRGDIDGALERLSVQGARREADIDDAVAQARAPGPLENIEASRAADIRQPDDFLMSELEAWDAMVRQIEVRPEVEAELTAIRDIEARANTIAEVAEAAAVCLARGIA